MLAYDCSTSRCPGRLASLSPQAAIGRRSPPGARGGCVQEGSRGHVRRKGFGASGLKVGGKIFAFISSKGAFVVKLPRERARKLIAARHAVAFDPGRGRVMKEWIAVRLPAAKWPSLAREARKFVGRLVRWRDEGNPGDRSVMDRACADGDGRTPAGVRHRGRHGVGGVSCASHLGICRAVRPENRSVYSASTTSLSWCWGRRVTIDFRRTHSPTVV